MSGIDTAAILENLGAAAWFADEEEVLRYVNRAAREKGGPVSEALGRNIEECHNPESVEQIRTLYRKWQARQAGVHIYDRKTENGRAYNILVPVYGDDGFAGVLELAFKVEN